MLLRISSQCITKLVSSRPRAHQRTNWIKNRHTQAVLSPLEQLFASGTQGTRPVPYRRRHRMSDGNALPHYKKSKAARCPCSVHKGGFFVNNSANAKTGLHRLLQLSVNAIPFFHYIIWYIYRSLSENRYQVI